MPSVSPLDGKARQSVLLANARLNIWEGSVRSSKTVSSLFAWLRFIRASPQGNLLMFGKTERTLKRNIIDPLVEWLGPKRCRYVAGSGELWLLGRRVYIAGANDERAQEKIRGLTLLGAYGDELSTAPESFLAMLLSRLSVPGATFFGTSNPDSPAHHLKRNFLDRPKLWLNHAGEVILSTDVDALDLARFSFKLADNPHLPPEYIASLEREYTGLWRKRFIEGLWVAAEGAVYSMFDPDVHVVDIIPPIVKWLCAGVDHGQANPFHAVLLGLGSDNVLYAVSEWRYDSRLGHRQMTDVEYSAKLREWLTTVRFPGTRLYGPMPEFLVIDPSAASFKVQCMTDGWSIADADNDVLNGIRVVSSLLATGKLKISRECKALIDELPAYCWDDKAMLLGQDKPVKVNDHGCDALRYACYSTRGLWHSRIPLATQPVAEALTMGSAWG